MPAHVPFSKQQYKLVSRYDVKAADVGFNVTVR